MRGEGPELKSRFRDELGDAKTLDQVLEVVMVVMEELRGGAGGRLGYVSGIITSDDKDSIDLNRKRLEGYTSFLRGEVDFPLFSSNDIFFDELEERVSGSSREDWYSFWGDVVSSGHITDIFMTPRWRESLGAKDEHKVAKKAGINIHYMDGHSKLTEIMNSHKK